MKKLTVMVLCSAVILSGCQNSALKTQKNEEQKLYILETTRNYGGLIEIYRNKLKIKDNEAVRLKLAHLYYLTNNYNSSLFYLTPLLNKSQSAQVFLLYGKNLMNTAQYPHPTEETYDRNASANISINESEKLKKAKYFVEKAISIDRKNGEAYNVLGIIEVKLQQLDKAEVAFNEARALFYDEIKVTNNLAMISILQKDYRKAYGYLMQLYSNGNRESVLIHNLLFTIVKLGDYELARRFCIEQKFSDFPDILINELKQTEPKDMVNYTMAPPAVSTVKTQYQNDLIEGSKIRPAAPKTVKRANQNPTSSYQEDSSSVLQNIKTLPEIKGNNIKPISTNINTRTNINTSTPNPVAKTNAASPAVTSKNAVIDMRVGEHKNYSRVVIETEKKGNFTINKISDQNYTITINDISLNEKVVKGLLNRIKKSDRNFVSINLSASGQDTLIINLVTKNIQKVDVLNLPPEDGYKYLFVLDFKTE